MANTVNRLQRLIRSFCSPLPASLIRPFERLAEIYIKRKYYGRSDNRDADASLICVVSKWINNGGLTDRINGIISAYYASELSGRRFGLIFDSPFDLTNYLVPNKVDWRLTPDRISFGRSSIPVFIRAFNRSMSDRFKQLVKAAERNKNRQLHVFTNVLCGDNGIYHAVYHKLFKPSGRLREMIDKELENIGSDYISVTFRFQQLLGDFREGDYQTLPDNDARELTAKCVSDLKAIHSRNEGKTIVVTSDSSTFLHEAGKLPYVKTVSGTVVHMQYTDSNDFLVHAKAFVDLYVIANAQVIYIVINSPMHDSGFPRLASKIYRKPFIKVIDGSFQC